MKPEDRIHLRAVAYLRQNPHVRFWHTPNENRETQAMRQKRWRMGVQPGIPDLVFVSPILAALELKSPKGRTTTEQKQWLADLSGAGFATSVSKGHIAAAVTLHSWGMITDDQLQQWVEHAELRDPEAK